MAWFGHFAKEAARSKLRIRLFRYKIHSFLACANNGPVFKSGPRGKISVVRPMAKQNANYFSLSTFFRLDMHDDTLHFSQMWGVTTFMRVVHSYPDLSFSNAGLPE